jgi:hypothetical protein
MSSKGTIVVISSLGLVALTAFAAGGSRSDATPSARAAGSASGVLDAASGQDARPVDQIPHFNDAGELIRPEGWQAWVMVGASIGLSYAEDGGFEPVMEGSAPGMFHNVYMQPWSYRGFRETGEFPEGTMFILAMYEASQNADPARGGWYEDEGFLAEIHLKREDLHESGWGFYGFGGDAESASMIPGEANCYSCHAEETALDNVFVQFYPALRDKLPADSGD